MKTKSQIVSNWLPRYTGTTLNDFGDYILLVNFANYVRMFADWHGVEVRGQGKPLPNATAQGMTIINFGIGFYHQIPSGALLLASGQPIVADGIKTATSDQKVTKDFSELHLRIGVESLNELSTNGLTVKHLKF